MASSSQRVTLGLTKPTLYGSPMQAAIRLARESDAEFLPAVERSASEAFRTVDWLVGTADGAVLTAEVQRGFIRQGACWVAVDEPDEVVGFLTAEPCGDELHVWELDVRLDRQRQGYGRALVETAIGWAGRQGLTAVTLTTFRGIAWNEPFYARLGFATLRSDQLGDRLAVVLRRERGLGLPMDRRCAMRLGLTPPRR